MVDSLDDTVGGEDVALPDADLRLPAPFAGSP
jgi:hypothetical protein